MDIIRIEGGLGNQMFQYAFFLSKKEQQKNVLAIVNPKTKNVHNGYELEKVFGIKSRQILNLRILGLLARSSTMKRRKHITNLFGIRGIVLPAQCDFDERYFQPGPKGINFYCGGWGSEKYFESISDNIRTIFSFKTCNNDSNVAVWEKRILQSNSVSIHIRRGDYNNSCFDGVCTNDYYIKAIAYIQKQIPNCNYFFFSNDIEWCRNNFHIPNSYFVDCNQGTDSWRDMYLMTLCKHHIVANSTFSWWGAWLGRYDNGITIRPKWFIRDLISKDFYPENWILIDYESK